jgi:biotin transport system substrate-specific component
MSMTATATQRPGVLADLLGGGLVRDLAMVAGSAAFVGLSAQAAIPLPFTPVPISLQTFAVLLSAAALGPVRAGAGMGLYLMAGAAGVPWFSEQNSGIGFPSFGYIIGFVLAAVIVGALARRGGDRSVAGAALLMLLGNLVIYATGVPYLALALGVGLDEAIRLGAVPFLVGDGLKILLAAGLLPIAWRVAGATDSTPGS